MTESRAPQVSILLPSYNYGWCLSEAIRSVLAQTLQDFELIIADDGSSDNSWQLLETFQKNHPDKIKIVRHPSNANLGLAATYRLALEQARGRYLAFLEADDLWTPENLERKIGVLERHTETGVAFSSAAPFGDFRGVLYWRLYLAAVRRETPRNRPCALWRPFLKRNPAATFSSFVTYRHFFAAVPPPGPGELNYDWWVLAHLSVRTSFYFIPEPLIAWRIHSRSAHYGAMTRKKTLWLQHFLAGLYASLHDHTKDGAVLEALKEAGNDLKYYRAILEERNPVCAGLLLAKKPLDTGRFLIHVLLKKLLTRRTV